ncbi:4Fe-4S dicluster domain-containing protein [Fibrobacter sp. UBA4309]|uniref:4Fe-4S dicluster domain-containing protein n=1 Tax=Fibrobacter sp. UBA4309 TaxID=1946537 RepID=UPI0025BBA68F|nr:4Fe-4S dicluster domain-containing protein [Fibrobacter sp. UBA4309]
MDRREFIKSCSLVAVMGLLFGCRKSELLGDIASQFSVPELKRFEDEVKLAMSRAKKSLDLVRVSAPGPLKIPGASPVNRFGMAIDLDLCDGCGKCILACNLENNVPLVPAEDATRGRFMHWVEMRGNAPLMCAHCGDAPCEKVCPTGAANHTPDGISAMMYKRCTGSRFCGANCPVHARKFNFNDAQSLGLARQFNKEVPLRDKGVMEKCSLCLHRLQNDRLAFKTRNPLSEWRGRGVKTACAEACPKNAIVFGNWLDPESPLARLAKTRILYAPREVAALDPSVVFVRGRR